MKVPRSTLGVGLLLFGWFILSFSFSSGQPYGSPDEAANAFFIHQFAVTGQARATTRLTVAQLAYAHPRSMVVQGQDLLPASFLGLIQGGGLLERWFGSGAGRWLIPLLSTLGLAAFYGILRRFWSVHWSLTGLALLMFQPVWWQFQTLPMFHNGALVSLLLVAGYCLRRQFERPSWKWAMAVGLAYGAAIFFRPIEILWTGPLLAIVLLTMPGRWKWFSIAVIAAIVVQLPWLLTDKLLYGSYFSTGYTPEGLLSDQGQAPSIITSLWRIITPAGGRWSWHFLSSAWWYIILIFPASSALAFASISTYLRKKFIQWQKIIKLSLISIFIIFPLAYYGSWDLYPLLPASRVGTLSSYDRYWLVLFVAMVPAIVLTLKRLWSIRPVLSVSTTTLVIASYLVTIIWHPGSGLRIRHERQVQARQLTSATLVATPENSLIVAGANDKYFIGQRLTATHLPASIQQWTALVTIIGQRPTYLMQSAAGLSTAQLHQLLLDYHVSLVGPTSLPNDTLWRLTSTVQ